MPPRLIDSHCHVDGREFDADRDAVLARARAAGVGTMVVVGTGRDVAQLRRAVDLAEREPDVVPVVGVHPHDAARFTGAAWDEVEALARHPRVAAVGEIGLDYHYDHSPRDTQVEGFRRQIGLARRLGKPIVCHIREAHPEALAVLREERAGDAGPVVIHCFTGTPDDAAAYVSLGYYVSFSGIVTFPAASAQPIREAVRRVPLARLLVETDAPYLAPVPMRGKRNEPAFVTHTAEAVARELGMPLEELAAATVANTSAVFRLTG